MQPTATKCNSGEPWDAGEDGAGSLHEDMLALAGAARARRGLRFDVLPPRASVLERLAAERASGRGSGGPELELESVPTRCIRRAREEWIGRVEGREGCWEEGYMF